SMDVAAEPRPRSPGARNLRGARDVPPVGPTGPRVRTTRSRGVGEDSPMTETTAATLDDVRGSAGRIAKSIESVIEGKPEVVRVTLTVLLAEGHLLIEDVPGVGKTMLAKALARS